MPLSPTAPDQTKPLFKLSPLLLVYALTTGLLLTAAPAQAAAKPTTARSQPVAEILAASQPHEWRALDPENTLYLELPAGRVVMELAPDFAPEHTRNIKILVREKYFDGLSILRAQDNYVVQWGDPNDEDASARPLGSAMPTLPPEYTDPVLYRRGYSL